MDLSRKVSANVRQRIPKRLLFAFFAFSSCCLVPWWWFSLYGERKPNLRCSIFRKNPFGESLFFLLLLCFYVQVFFIAIIYLCVFALSLSLSLFFSAALHRDGFSAPVFIAYCCIALNLHNMLNNINFLAFILN